MVKGINIYTGICSTGQKDIFKRCINSGNIWYIILFVWTRDIWTCG